MTEFEAPAQAVGSIAFGVWLEQRVTEESLREMITTAEGSDALIGLVGAQTGVSSVVGSVA